MIHPKLYREVITPKNGRLTESSDTGGLFVGGAHVVTDLVVNSVTAGGPDEEPDVTIEIDDTGFFTD